MRCKPPQVAWRSSSTYDMIAWSGWQKECFKSYITCFESQKKCFELFGRCFSSFHVLQSVIAGFHNLWSPGAVCEESNCFDTFLNMLKTLNIVSLVWYNLILTILKPLQLWSFYQFCTYPIRGSLSVLYFDICVLLFCPSLSILPKSNDFPACSVFSFFNFLYLCFLYWQWSGVVPYLLITISMELRDGCQPARPSCPQSPH